MKPHTFPPPAGTSAGLQQPSAGTENHSALVLSAAPGHGVKEGQRGGSHITHKKTPNTCVCVFAYACIHIIIKLLLKSSEPPRPWAHSCGMF